MAKKKILLIDYDQEFLKFLARALADEGYEIATATDGLAGFERFSEVHPDLVIMEAMLPKFHGFELCSRITSHPTKKAPVIIVTGIYKDSVYKTEAMRSLGASAFFEKPLNLEELLNKIYELVGRPEPKKVASPASTATPAEKALDQLLKEALSLDLEEKKPEGKPGPAAKPRTEEKPKPVDRPAPRPAPAKEPVLSKDDEVDLILKSKLKDLMIENSRPEPQPAPRPVTRPEKEKPAARPSEIKKTAQVTSDSLLDELTRKPAAQPAPSRPPRTETPKTEVSPEPVSRPRLEPKPEPARETKKEIRPTSPAPVDSKPKPSAPVVTPFKGFIEEEEENNKEKSRGGAGKYIGLVAAILAVAGLVAFLTLKKKEAPAFSGQNSNQVAALQTGTGDPTRNEPSETELQQEIEKQMDTYRTQKTETENKAPARQNQSDGKKNSRSTEPAPVAPLIPEQKTRLAEMKNPQPAEQPGTVPSAQAETSSQTSGGENASSKEEKAAGLNQAEAEPQVIIPAQVVNPGDLLPLNMVDVEPKIIKTVEPVYPEADRRLGNSGQVLLNVLISENGDVLEAAVIRGIKGSVALEKEAINAVKRWKFLPAEKNGVKVRVWKPVTIGFGLNK
ncbi:MAG: TonB family protein [Candidatus Saccharicenans sp.]|nr:TonB family protein [Candidatus Saccharicenans sp.]